MVKNFDSLRFHSESQHLSNRTVVFCRQAVKRRIKDTMQRVFYGGKRCITKAQNSLCDNIEQVVMIFTEPIYRTHHSSSSLCNATKQKKGRQINKLTDVK